MSSITAVLGLNKMKNKMFSGAVLHADSEPLCSRASRLQLFLSRKYFTVTFIAIDTPYVVVLALIEMASFCRSYSYLNLAIETAEPLIRPNIKRFLHLDEH